VLSFHRIGKSRVSRVVLGFYRSEEHGREALHEARNHGFRQSAVIYRSPDGELSHFHDGLGPRERALLGVATSVAVTVLARIAGVPAWAVAVLALAGFLISWFGTLQLRVGLRHRVLRDYSGSVLPGESLVVVEGSEEEVADIIAVLQHISEEYWTGPLGKRAIRAQLVTLLQIHQQVRARVTLDEVRLVGQHAWVWTSGEITGQLAVVGTWVQLFVWERELEVARREQGVWRLYGYQQ